MGSLLAIHDPSGKLGLTDPSPGGGEVPLRCLWPVSWPKAGQVAGRLGELPGSWPQALLLVTEDGTPDPVGMARAREVLARRKGINPFAGVIFARTAGGWSLVGGSDLHSWPDLPHESAPEALARLLAEHAGVEVVRG